MTHDEFCAEVEKLKTYRSRDVFFDTLAELCFRRIASLEIDIMKRDAEIENLKTRLSGKTNHCEACEGMGQEIAKLKETVRNMPLYTIACKDCPPPYRNNEDCPEHEPTCIECWLEWMAKQ